jgi:SpoVK/Ycf46/Vps4 family AAA+-type ATPase
VALKKQLVERDCNGLIEFIESKRSLDDLHGQEKVKEWLRADFALWKKNDIGALPMGYLLCGPVGTGKTYMVECLAGEAGVPVVKLKNFRDKWIGSTEGNLEKIFRLLQALGRCFVFIDEADQALGRRDAQAGDSGVSGRVYSMMAEEMSNTRNRGRIIWILASSRPDLIEVDLKRPGRIDVKIPLLPTSSARESFGLLQMLCKRKGIEIDETAFAELEARMPKRLTPGAAETLAVKVYRLCRTQSLVPLDSLRSCLTEYRHPVPREVLDFQIALAVREASDVEFVPTAIRDYASPSLKNSLEGPEE